MSKLSEIRHLYKIPIRNFTQLTLLYYQLREFLSLLVFFGSLFFIIIAGMEGIIFGMRVIMIKVTHSFNSTSYISRISMAFEMYSDIPPIEAWDPGTPLPTGDSVDHDSRDISYLPEEIPSWFTAQPSGNASQEREPDPDLPCEKADAPSLSWQDKTQDSLNDFEPDKELLGCALTDPFHNYRHGAVGGEPGDMSYPDRAPKDPIFWRFHKYIDDVSDARDDLTPLGTIGNASLTDTERDNPTPIEFIKKISSNAQTDRITIGLDTSDIPKITTNDTSPPQIESQNPRTDLSFLTDKLEELSINFNEPVENVVAG